jgi:hypothetical protein
VSRATRDLICWHWSYLLPEPFFDAYMLWLARRRYALNIEQIERDEIDDLAALGDDGPQAIQRVYDHHATRRTAARFFVATREARRLRRLAHRWDVDVPLMIHRGEADEDAIAHVRRRVREARWTFVERCSQTLVPTLSLIVAILALLWR